MRKTISALLLILVLCGTVSAVYIPLDIRRENVDGRQLITKTYEMEVDDDPEALIEPSFDEDGFTYAYFEMTQLLIAQEDSKPAVQTVTLDSPTDDLAEALKLLDPAIEVSEDGYQGYLTLDHTSVAIAVKSYSTKSYTITDTQTIGGLDRNDPAYVPRTAIKNGVTLSLQDISWAVQETALTGSDLVPSTYMATVTYKGSYARSVADGYTVSARYTGKLHRTQQVGIRYTVTYLGTPIPIPEPEAPEVEGPPGGLYLICAGALLTVLIAFILYRALRRNVLIYVQQGDDYLKVGALRVSAKSPTVDLSKAGIPERLTDDGSDLAILLRKSLASKLLGRTVTTLYGDQKQKTLVDKAGADFWYHLKTTTEEEK